MRTKTILNKIKTLSKGMTNYELAKASGLYVQYIASVWGRRSVSIERLQAMLNGLGYEMRIRIVKKKPPKINK